MKLTRGSWEAAVWESDLTPPVKLVALAVGRAAASGISSVALSVPEAQAVTGLGRTVVVAAFRVLRERGWLLLVREANHHDAPVHALWLPELGGR